MAIFWGGGLKNILEIPRFDEIAVKIVDIAHHELRAFFVGIEA